MNHVLADAERSSRQAEPENVYGGGDDCAGCFSDDSHAECHA